MVAINHVHARVTALEWHLGACDNRYEPTYRGFDSFMGYLAGGEGYYNHRNDFRNGSATGETPFCMGEAVANNYSSTLFAGEVSRIVRAHDSDIPMFMCVHQAMLTKI